MQGIETRKIERPYCGELIELLIDLSVFEQSYIEDCQVCCRPIQLEVVVSAEEDICIRARHENE